MSHKDNFKIVQDLLKNNYEKLEGYSVPFKKDLTFDNKYKKVKNVVVVYLDMRGSRKIMFDQSEYRSLKTHRAFLHAFISCVDYDGGRFRSFNGDGALAFFNGEDSSARAVRACMNFNRYMAEINSVLDQKDMLQIDYGIGIARGSVYVAKTGKKGAESTRQDLIWVGYPTYLSVELSDRGSGAYHLWISKAMYDQIHTDDSDNSYDILYWNNGERGSIWSKETITLKNGQVETAYKTSAWFNLDLTD